MPFTAFFPAGVADPTLIGRLTSQRELQGLLRMAVGGLQQVMRRGAFTLPASVSAATQRFRREADPIRGFIDERIRGEREAFTPRTDIYGEYAAWASMNGFMQMSAARFYESFTAACAETHPTRTVMRNGVRGFVHIRIME